MDVLDLKEFYASRLGHATRRIVVPRLQARLRGLKDAQIAGLGYASPYLESLQHPNQSALSMMPARLGVTHWPLNGQNCAVLVDESCLPLADGSLDLALVVHGLELTDHLPDLLRELWRVLAPQGRAVFIVPNRRGVWARFDHTPFGHGRPFSRSQLMTLLRDAQFSPAGWTNLLFVPPSQRGFVTGSSVVWERVGSWVGPGFSGLIMVEAIKQVYAVSGGKRRQRLVPVLRPDILPQPARSGL